MITVFIYGKKECVLLRPYWMYRIVWKVGCLSGFLCTPSLPLLVLVGLKIPTNLYLWYSLSLCVVVVFHHCLNLSHSHSRFYLYLFFPIPCPIFLLVFVLELYPSTSLPPYRLSLSLFHSQFYDLQAMPRSRLLFLQPV